MRWQRVFRPGQRRSQPAVFVTLRSRENLTERHAPARSSRSLLKHGVRIQRELHQHPTKNAARKSKKSCESTLLSRLKSAAGSRLKKAARKAKKSWELATPSTLKSAGQGSGMPGRPVTMNAASWPL